MRRPAQKHHPDPEKTPEYAVPSGPARKSPAYYRGRYGGDAVDGADYGKHCCKVTSRVDVRCYRSGNDDTSGSGDALDKPHGYEQLYVRCVYAACSGCKEQHEGRDKRRLSTGAVAYGTEYELADGQACHAG